MKSTQQFCDSGGGRPARGAGFDLDAPLIPVRHKTVTFSRAELIFDMHRLGPAVTSLCLLAPLPAAATISDLFCDDTSRIEQQLKVSAGASRIGQGIRGPDALLEVWATPNNAEWTLVQTYANGTSCIVAIGQHWETLVAPDGPT